MGRRPWCKLWSEPWLRGKISRLALEVRGSFATLLALAADSAYGHVGAIQIDETMGYTDIQVARLLSMDARTWPKHKEVFVAEDLIKVGEANQITIVNWEWFQSDYNRQKPYRKREQSPKVTRTSEPKVTPRGYNAKREVEEEVEEEEKKRLKDVNGRARESHSIKSLVSDLVDEKSLERQALVAKIIDETGDGDSRGYWAGMVKVIPKPEIYRMLSVVKDARLRGEIRETPRALLTHLMKTWCKDHKGHEHTG